MSEGASVSEELGFMYDCHVFARVPSLARPRSEVRARLVELFKEDGCGMAFSQGDRRLVLHGHLLLQGGWGVTESEIDAFLDKAEERFNWMCRS